MLEIILVCINNFQEYILDNIKNLILLHSGKSNNNNTKTNITITVITNLIYFDKFDIFQKDDNLDNLDNLDNINVSVNLIDCAILDDYGFNNNSRLDNNFRNGFWKLCSLRIVYLYSYMQKYNKENIFHLENDVLLYQNINDLFNCFIKHNVVNKILIPFDNTSRAILSIMFIPNHYLLKEIINNWDENANDMELFPSLLRLVFS